MVLFAPRFLETHAGSSILTQPITALIELVANAWDAGATRVDITWPSRRDGRLFSLVDNGHGMTAEQFQRRWLMLAYDRSQEQGDCVEVPTPDGGTTTRIAFGRNGIGRHGAFAFGSSYVLTTWREGTKHSYRISLGKTTPLEVVNLGSGSATGHGTSISSEIGKARFTLVTADAARRELGMRFLVDPQFAVFVDGVQVGIDDIPAEQ
ncbi:ATP-binding protein, partial [Longimicrobium sp.]|uniref:ATP-binding protein n=1 Tax=Longimicrobium sp. TaxID=2029185 RepID=UPI002F92BBC3